MVCNTTGDDGTYFFFFVTGAVVDAVDETVFISVVSILSDPFIVFGIGIVGDDATDDEVFCCKATIDAIICAATEHKIADLPEADAFAKADRTLHIADADIDVEEAFEHGRLSLAVCFVSGSHTAAGIT